MPRLTMHPLALHFAVTAGETIQTVLNRFNAFRSPERQITELFDRHGQLILNSTQITADIDVWIRSA